MKIGLSSFHALFGAVTFVVFLQCYQAQGQVVGSGACPVFNVPSLSSTPFLCDTYYEIFRYPSAMERDFQCVTHSYCTSTGMVTIIGTKQGSGRKITITGNMTKAVSSEYSNVNLKFPGPAPELDNIKNPFPSTIQVLAKDGNWMVLWSCKNYLNYHLKYSWVLSLFTKTPNESQVESALLFLDKYAILRSDYQRTTQSYC